MIVIEYLKDRAQRFLLKHTDSITLLALQVSEAVLASASNTPGGSGSEIILWDMDSYKSRKHLAHSAAPVTVLSFSPDDRVLISIGNHVSPKLHLWDVDTGQLYTVVEWPAPIHQLAWQPYADQEFATCGTREITFWALENEGDRVVLKVYSAFQLPFIANGR